MYKQGVPASKRLFKWKTEKSSFIWKAHARTKICKRRVQTTNSAILDQLQMVSNERKVNE